MEGGTAERRRSTPWRDNVEALAMAITMALFLKYFIVEAYKIPSGSMQPTLFGDDRAGVFDRILVDKLSYRFRDPERFEVVVFKYPLDLSKSFVKRLVGIGPEDLMIQGGDVWRRADESEPWRVLRRPRGAQRAMWRRLDREEPLETAWTPEPADLPWEAAGRRVVARGAGAARFGGEGAVMDDFLHGYPDALRDRVRRKPGTGVHPVGDLRVDGAVEVGDGTEAVGVALVEGPRRYELLLPGPAAPADARPTIRVRTLSRFDDGAEIEVAVADAPLRLSAGRRYRFGAQNLDDLLELELDGRVLVALEIAPASDQRASAAVIQQGGIGALATFDDLMAYRDVYYTGGDELEYRVPAGAYFMLGDNTQDSSDSRMWKLARVETPDRAVLVGNSRRDDADPWQKNPWVRPPALDGGGEIRFRDVYGETRWLEGPGIPWADPPTESLPFVPRRLIQGRALAVFWPLSPPTGVYRWKWIR